MISWLTAASSIAAGNIDEDFLDGIGVVTKLGGNGVKTVDQA